MDRRRSAHIVPEIYEATINPAHWDYVVSMIAKLTKSTSACIYYKNNQIDIASTIAQYGMPEDQRLSFGDQCDTIDGMFSAGAGGGDENLACAQFHPGSNAILPENSELYLKWMKPNGIYHVGGAQFVKTDMHKAGIAILRDRKSGTWDKGDTRVIDEILPHLRRALNIHSEFSILRLRQDALLKGLDRLVIGLILYDSNANAVYINPIAKAIVKNHPAMHLQGRQLVLNDPEEDKNLRMTIEQTAVIDPEDSWKQSVAIGVKHPDSKSPLPLLVTPMHVHQITSNLDYGGAKVAVFLTDPNLQQPISVDSLVSVYKLTPSESQVAISLANGHSIDAIARQTNHSAHTIRTHLKSVFRKTGVSRQNELIKLLLTAPYAQRRRSSES